MTGHRARKPRPFQGYLVGLGILASALISKAVFDLAEAVL